MHSQIKYNNQNPKTKCTQKSSKFGNIKKIKKLFIAIFLWYNILHANFYEFIKLKHKRKLHLGEKSEKKKKKSELCRI